MEKVSINYADGNCRTIVTDATALKTLLKEAVEQMGIDYIFLNSVERTTDEKKIDLFVNLKNVKSIEIQK